VNKVVALLGGNRAADAFRKTVSGDPTGAPAWAQQMAIGNDVGLFGPESAVWEVHGSISTLVGGIRALLMQAAHPAALTGVAEHSQYDTDPLGRLERTTRWLTITTFGSTEAIEREARRVNELHSHVKGEYPAKDGRLRHIALEMRAIFSGCIAHLLILSSALKSNWVIRSRSAQIDMCRSGQRAQSHWGLTTHRNPLWNCKKLSQDLL
jgi:hypothetical protein